MLGQKVQAFLAKARQRPELRGVNSTINAHSRQLLVDVDRERTESQGVAVQDVYQALQVMFGSLYVSQFPKSKPPLSGDHPGRTAGPHAAGGSAADLSAQTSTVRWCR